jgi:hypothetical protein
VGNLSITYRPREDASADTERALLADAYSYLLTCHAKEKGAALGALDAAKESENDCDAAKIIPPR